MSSSPPFSCEALMTPICSAASAEKRTPGRSSRKSCGQLNCERDAVETMTDRYDRRSVRVVHAKRDASCHEKLHPCTHGSQLRHDQGCFCKLLKVVENEEHVTIAKKREHIGL